MNSVVAYNGNERILLFDCESRSEAMNKVEVLLTAVVGDGCDSILMSKLNEIQQEAQYGSGKVNEKLFPNKYEMPLSIINLILEKYNLEITEYN